MINDEADEVIKELYYSLKIDIKIIQNPWEVVSLSSIMFIYYVINVKSWKTSYSFNDSNLRKWHYLAVKNYQRYYEE